MVPIRQYSSYSVGPAARMEVHGGLAPPCQSEIAVKIASAANSLPP
jgi:hypothetical protein